MKITIHRGQNQIGGNVVEISTQTTRILLDIGSELGEGALEDPGINSLILDRSIDAVFISHYHGDHMGLVYKLDPQIPLYMSRSSYEIINAANEFKGMPTFKKPWFFREGVPVQIGDLTISPVLCDHSAYDSHMFLIQSGGNQILYTGDFRANGRKSFEELLGKLPTGIDGIIVEGTTVSRNDKPHRTEAELEQIALKKVNDAKGPIFVLMSAQNVDRITTMANVAQSTGRIFLQDVYMAGITHALAGNIANPATHQGVRVFTTKSLEPNSTNYLSLNQYGRKKIGRSQIAKQNFVMCVRASMLDYLKELNHLMTFKNGYLFYSMWEGYKDQSDMKDFLQACETMGLQVVSLHTSGHADPSSLKKLIEHTNPAVIIPIHTLAAGWFQEAFGKGKQVVLKESKIEI